MRKLILLVMFCVFFSFIFAYTEEEAQMLGVTQEEANNAEAISDNCEYEWYQDCYVPCQREHEGKTGEEAWWENRQCQIDCEVERCKCKGEIPANLRPNFGGARDECCEYYGECAIACWRNPGTMENPGGPLNQTHNELFCEQDCYKVVRICDEDPNWDGWSWPPKEGEEDGPAPVPQECENSCPEGQAQNAFPDCSCVQKQISQLKGKIFYNDFQGVLGKSSILNFGMKDEKALPYVKFTFFYQGYAYDAFTDSKGEFSLNINPPIPVNDSVEASFYISLIDGKERFYVVTEPKAVDKADDGTTLYGGNAAYFEKNFKVTTDENGVMEYKCDLNETGKSNEYMAEGAKIYRNVFLAVEYAENILGESVDKTKPVPIVIAPQGDTAYHVADFGIAIGDGCANMDYPDAPINREWHEFGHYIMYDGFTEYPEFSGDTNHGSFANPSSTDSFNEGWAEVFASSVNKYYKGTTPHLYPVGNTYSNLEVNHKIVGRGESKVIEDEEIVAASLLWDLLDGKKEIDEDYVEIEMGEFWEFIKKDDFTFSNGSTGNIQNLADLYDALNSTSKWDLKKDGDKDGINNLDEIFISHGIFKDDDESKNFTSGERVGVTLREGKVRRKVQPRDNANLGIDIRSDSGEPIDSIVKVKVDFAPPYDYYDYEYDVFVPAEEGKLNLELPGKEYDVTATVSAEAPEYKESDEVYTTTNEEFWEKVAETPSGGNFAEQEFTLEYEGSVADGICGPAFVLAGVLLVGIFIRK